MFDKTTFRVFSLALLSEPSDTTFQLRGAARGRDATSLTRLSKYFPPGKLPDTGSKYVQYSWQYVSVGIFRCTCPQDVGSSVQSPYF